MENMRQSQLFTKTKKESPADEVSLNAELLIKAGFINKEIAGVYSFLPLGLRVLNKVQNIIREEINNIGGQELFLTSLQEKTTWEKTNRWSDDVVDNWFKTKLKNETELGLAFTHEEPLTKLMKEFVSSYRDLPFSAYQFQTKFRNETRAKSGIMRTREFIMKDLYSFSKDEEQHMEFYEKSKEAYKNIFKRVGIGHITYLTFASGGVFSKYSPKEVPKILFYDHEKQILVTEWLDRYLPLSYSFGFTPPWGPSSGSHSSSGLPVTAGGVKGGIDVDERGGVSNVNARGRERGGGRVVLESEVDCDTCRAMGTIMGRSHARTHR